MRFKKIIISKNKLYQLKSTEVSPRESNNKTPENFKTPLNIKLKFTESERNASALS